jgi:hypothetical protein
MEQLLRESDEQVGVAMRQEHHQRFSLIPMFALMLMWPMGCSSERGSSPISASRPSTHFVPPVYDEFPINLESAPRPPSRARYSVMIFAPGVFVLPRPEIDAHVHFMNLDDVTHEYSTDLLWKIRVIVLTESGERVAETRARKHQRVSLLSFVGWPRNTGNPTIPPGGVRYISRIPVDEWFDVSLPGKYRILLVDPKGEILAQDRFELHGPHERH